MYQDRKVVICGICSRHKDNNPNPLPAKERYLGSHVVELNKLSVQQNVPFFILSGKYGFISGDEEIADYDLLLTADKVPLLVPVIVSQLSSHNVGVIHFYTKTKPTWKAYLDALQQAAEIQEIKLLIYELPEEL